MKEKFVMSNNKNYSIYYYVNPSNTEMGKKWYPTVKSAWLEDPAWLNVACFKNEGKPISFKADKPITGILY